MQTQNTKTIDCTPTWENCVPILFALLDKGTARDAVQYAKDEILRMAQMADEYVAIQHNELKAPPAVIKIKDDFSAGLDLRNPLHAAAYLKAANHFLSFWPQDWSAERLCLALVDDESPDQKKVGLWGLLEREATNHDSDPYLYTDEFISSLAQDFLTFGQTEE